MKQRLVLSLFGAACLYLVVCGYSYGYGRNETGSQGRTGCSCHGSSSSVNPIVELDSQGVAVTSYIGGMNYTVKLSGTANSSQQYFGFELSTVKATGAGTNSATMAGTWGTLPSGTGTFGSTFVVVQQTQRLAASSNMYSISIPWTAPAAGTGSVKIYGLINAVNGDGGTGGDGAQTATNNGLTITEAVSCPTVAISGTDSAMSAVVTGGTATGYQWYNNGSLISGATSASYIATASGSYTVAVTAAGGCNPSSSAYVYNKPNGIAETAGIRALQVYPVPMGNNLYVSFSTQSATEVSVLLTDQQGRTIQQLETAAAGGAFSHSFEVSALAPGIYLLKVQSNGAAATTKLIKE